MNTALVITLLLAAAALLIADVINQLHGRPITVRRLRAVLSRRTRKHPDQEDE